MAEEITTFPVLPEPIDNTASQFGPQGQAGFASQFTGDIYSSRGRFGNGTDFWVIDATSMQSANFVTGVSGCQILYNGNVEFNDGYFRGDISAATGTFTGSIIATTGSIGGWTVDATSIKDTAGTVGMSSAITVGDDIRFWAGHITPGSAPFRVTEAGALVATSATITGAITATSGATAGWIIDATSLKDASGTVGMSSAVTAGDDIRFWAGNVTPASAPFKVTEAGVITATSGTIGGWTLGATTLTATGISLDAGNFRIGVGASNEILIDGANKKIESSNYVSGVFGAGFHLDSNLLEVGNIACRGLIRTAVFQKDVVNVMGGNFAVLDGDVLDADMTASDTSTLTTKGNTTFAVGDILRIKDGVDDEWMEVVVGSLPVDNNDGTMGMNFDLAAGGSTNCTVLGVSFALYSDSYILTSCDFSLKKWGTPSGNVYAKLYAHSGVYGTSSLPTGPVLATSDPVDSTSLGTNWSLITFTFTGAQQYSLSANTKYCLQLEYSGPEGLNASGTSAQHPGNSYRYINGSWAILSGDFIFHTYGKLSAPRYSVTRDKDAQYSAGANPTWKKGATVVNYKQTGNGGVYMTASDTNAPYIDVFTHAGSPWDTITTKARLGWLKGITDADVGLNSTDVYGLYSDSVYLKGTIVASGGSIGGWTIGATDLSATSSGNTTILSSGATAFSAGPTGSPTVTITQAGVLSVVGGTITGSTIQTGTSGRRLVLWDNEALRLFGSDDSGRGYLTDDSGTGFGILLKSYDGRDHLDDEDFVTWTTDTNLTNWTEDGVSAGVRDIDKETTEVYTGLYSVKLTATANDGTDFGIYQDHSTGSGTWFLTVWTKISSRTAGKIKLDAWNQTDGVSLGSAETTTTGSWIQLKVYFTLTATKTVRVKMYFEDETAGTAYIDTSDYYEVGSSVTLGSSKISFAVEDLENFIMEKGTQKAFYYSVTNTVDIGTTALRFKNLYLAGTADATTSFSVAGTNVVGTQVSAIGLNAKSDANKITDIITALRAHGLIGPDA